MEFTGSQVKEASYPHTLENMTQRPNNKPASFFIHSILSLQPFPLHLSFHPHLAASHLQRPLLSPLQTFPGSSPQSYSQVGMLGQLVTPQKGESWPGVARGQPNTPWLREAVLKSPPFAAWCKFPRRRAGWTVHRWDGREEWKEARAKFTEEMLQPVTETNEHPGMGPPGAHMPPWEESAQMPPGVRTKDSGGRKGLRGPCYNQQCVSRSGSVTSPSVWETWVVLELPGIWIIDHRVKVRKDKH